MALDVNDKYLLMSITSHLSGAESGREWAAVAVDSSGQPGVCGALGTPASANIRGSRFSAVRCPILIITSRCLLRSRLLRNRFAIGAGVGAGKVHIALCVSFDRFPLPHPEGKWLQQLNLVSALG
jgi:hypothetical protein